MKGRLTLIFAFVAQVACGGPGLPEFDLQAYGAASAPACVPNLDGRIDADELPTVLNQPAQFRVAKDVPIDLSDWDWSRDRPGEERTVLQAGPLDDRWYASSFPAGEFVLPLDAAGADEVVYAREPGAILILGIVSAEADPKRGRTLIVYETPVIAYRFPLAPGAQWSSEGVVTGGLLRGLPYAARDRYEARVHALGQLNLPDLALTQAHQVRMIVTNTPAVGAESTTRQVSFLTECLGEVARARSNKDEIDENFTVAAELRRLGLP